MIFRPKTFFANYVYFYPTLALFTSMLGDKYSRLLAQLSLILFIAADISEAFKRKEKRKSHIAFFLFSVAFVCYVAEFQGFYQLLNSDFYALLLLFYILDFYRDKNNWQRLHSVALNEEKYKRLLVSYSFFLAISLFLLHGYRVYEAGPAVLHGPFTYPHAMAYSLIGMYCATGIIGCNEKLQYSLPIKVIITVGVVITGVRTAALSLAIIILVDYLSQNKFTIKIGIAVAIIMSLFILAEFTDVLVDNPIVQRTILAASQKTGASHGRELFNAYLLNNFHQLPIKDKIFGIGVNQIRYLMKLQWNVYIHAHNDLLNILLGYGILGCTCFVSLLLSFCRQSKRWGLLLLSILVLIYFNGLYMYHTFTPYLVMIPLFFNELYRREDIK